PESSIPDKAYVSFVIITLLKLIDVNIFTFTKIKALTSILVRMNNFSFFELLFLITKRESGYITMLDR
ncbi:hypothetical protein, partial [Vibrio parahaemolyticus]|uniref:hypothetical protein n=1 Tax=Vibrio parahaemolyticus TaxID=670 RepID=UPI001C5CDFF1